MLDLELYTRHQTSIYLDLQPDVLGSRKREAGSKKIT